MLLQASIVSSKINDKWDFFNFELVNLPFLDGDVPRSPSIIWQLIHLARVCFNIDDLNNRSKYLTSKLLKQGDLYHKNYKVFFSKFHNRHSELIVKYNICLKLFCNKTYQYLYFMTIEFLNLKELLESLILVINFITYFYYLIVINLR